MLTARGAEAPASLNSGAMQWRAAQGNPHKKVASLAYKMQVTDRIKIKEQTLDLRVLYCGTM